MTMLLKIVLAILLLLCLLSMPYGYYQFVRFAAMAGFVYLAYNSFEKGNKNEAYIYICLAILFQPFIKIVLGRTLWNVVDVIVAVFLILTIITTKEKSKPKSNAI